MSAAVELSGVRVAYGRAVILEVSQLEVRPGEILAVIGPNGSGKSTLLRVIGLLEAPGAGTVRFGGEVAGKGRLLEMRREMASVFQDPLLVDGTVFENVALGLRFRHVESSEVAARVEAWLDRFRTPIRRATRSDVGCQSSSDFGAAWRTCPLSYTTIRSASW